MVDSGSSDATARGRRGKRRSGGRPDRCPARRSRRGAARARRCGAVLPRPTPISWSSSTRTFSPSTRVSWSRCSARCSPIPAVQFVKAAYDRPPTDPAVPSNGGGRVTELMARPLISAFWPELVGVLQPLAGEYAARRDSVVPAAVPCGYGVDLGLLLDSYAPSGLDGIAQVDLRRRWHRHSDLPSLGTDGRGDPAHRVRPAGRGRAAARHELDAATMLWQPDRLEGGVRARSHQVDIAERPPLVEVVAATGSAERPQRHEVADAVRRGVGQQLSLGHAPVAERRASTARQTGTPPHNNSSASAASTAARRVDVAAREAAATADRRTPPRRASRCPGALSLRRALPSPTARRPRSTRSADGRSDVVVRTEPDVATRTGPPALVEQPGADPERPGQRRSRRSGGSRSTPNP